MRTVQTIALVETASGVYHVVIKDYDGPKIRAEGADANPCTAFALARQELDRKGRACDWAIHADPADWEED